MSEAIDRLGYQHSSGAGATEERSLGGICNVYVVNTSPRMPKA